MKKLANIATVTVVKMIGLVESRLATVFNLDQVTSET